MSNPVIMYIPQKDDILISEKEIYRYLGYSMETMRRAGTVDQPTGDILEDTSAVGDADESMETIRKMVGEAVRLTQDVMKPKACYGRFAVEVSGDGKILFPYGEAVSHDLTKNLHDCKEVFLFAATIGTEFDRQLRRIRLDSMAKAAVLQAAGAAAVESLCDKLNAELDHIAAEEGHKTHPRYSPGYGDYALDNQKGIFAVLQPSKYIGLSLMDTLIMAPEKSVTAVIGIEG